MANVVRLRPGEYDHRVGLPSLNWGTTKHIAHYRCSSQPEGGRPLGGVRRTRIRGNGDESGRRRPRADTRGQPQPVEQSWLNVLAIIGVANGGCCRASVTLSPRFLCLTCKRSSSGSGGSHHRRVHRILSAPRDAFTQQIALSSSNPCSFTIVT